MQHYHFYPIHCLSARFEIISENLQVVEERARESIFTLLAIGETGVRLILHNPTNTQSPLSVQDHFE